MSAQPPAGECPDCAHPDARHVSAGSKRVCTTIVKRGARGNHTYCACARR